MADKDDLFTLPGWEGAVYLWVEQESSIMLRASTLQSKDPVELTSADARGLAQALIAAADLLDEQG